MFFSELHKKSYSNYNTSRWAQHKQLEKPPTKPSLQSPLHSLKKTQLLNVETQAATQHHPSYKENHTTLPAQNFLLQDRIWFPSPMPSAMAMPRLTGVQVTVPACRFLSLQNKSCGSKWSSKRLHKVKRKKKSWRVFQRTITSPSCVPADQMSAPLSCTKSGETSSHSFLFLFSSPKLRLL